MIAKSKNTNRTWVGPVTALALIIAVVVVLKWLQAGSLEEKDEPGILRNLTTMIGNKAHAFTLKDSEGRTHSIGPGNGRNHVLIFHMGSI